MAAMATHTRATSTDRLHVCAHEETEEEVKPHAAHARSMERPLSSTLSKVGSGVGKGRRVRSLTAAATMTPRDMARARRASVAALNKKADPHVRLETITRAGTRFVLLVIYGTVLLAALVTASDELNFDNTDLKLGGAACPSLFTLPRGSASAVVDELAALHPAALRDGCTAGLGDNGTVWVGEVAGLHRLDGHLSLSFQATNLTGIPSDVIDLDASGFTFQLVYSARVEGSEGGSGQWSEVYASSNVVGQVECQSSGDGVASCDPLELFDSMDTTQVAGGGFTRYRLVVEWPYGREFAASGWSQAIMQGTVSRADGDAYGVVPRMVLTYRDVGFTAVSIGVRIALLVASVWVSVVWVRAYRKRPRAPPHVRWVSILLVVMLCWQNPIIVAAQLAPKETVLNAVAEVLHAFAWASMLMFWLIMIDGLRYPAHALPRRFYRRKLWFATAFFCVTLAMQLLKRASFYFPSVGPTFIEDQVAMRAAVLALCAVFLLLLVTWLVWFVRVSVATGRALKEQPYMQTRFRQLTFRFLIFQQTLVVVFAVAVNTFPAVRFLVDAIKGVRSDRELGSATQLLALLVGAYQPLGELVLLSVYAYMIAVLFLPPHQDRGASPGFLKGVRKRVAKAVGFEQPLFSLETACWLFDLAWEAYYDPPGHRTASGFGQMSVPPHGFLVDRFISDESADAHALVLRRGPRVVVAFRGTSSRKNQQTDLKFQRSYAEFSEDRRPALDVLSRIPGLRNLLPLVHRGFWSAYLGLRLRLRREVAASVIRAGPHARLYLTGHSLGGALATLAGYDLHPMVRRLKKQLYAPLRMPTPASGQDDDDDSAAVVGSGGEHRELRRTGSWSLGTPRRTLLSRRGFPDGELRVDGPTSGASDSRSGGGTPRLAGTPRSLSDRARRRQRQRRRSHDDVEVTKRARLVQLARRNKEQVADLARRSEAKVVEAVTQVQARFVQLGSSVRSKATTLREQASTLRSQVRRTIQSKIEMVRHGEDSDEERAVALMAADPSDSGRDDNEEDAAGSTAGNRTSVTLQIDPSGCSDVSDLDEVVVVVHNAELGLRDGAGTAVGAKVDAPTGAGAMHTAETAPTGAGAETVPTGAGAETVPTGAGAETAPTGAGAMHTTVDAQAGARSTTVIVGGAEESKGGLPAPVTGSASALDGAGAELDGAEYVPRISFRRQQEGGARHERRPTDWLGDRGLAGVDFAEEQDQGVGLVPEELEPDEYGDMDVVMYNFGSPRVGNAPFSLMYDSQVPHSFRIVFDGDVITAVPKFILMYKHIGCEVEVDRLGNVIVDPSALEKHFRSPAKTRFSSHSMYAYRDGLRAARRHTNLPEPAHYSLYRPTQWKK